MAVVAGSGQWIWLAVTCLKIMERIEEKEIIEKGQSNISKIDDELYKWFIDQIITTILYSKYF